VSFFQSLGVASLLALALEAAPLRAQAPSPPTLANADSLLKPGGSQQTTKKEPPPWIQFTGNLGFVNTSGNTKVSTLSLSEGFRLHTSRSNKVSQDFGLTYGTVTSRVESNLWTVGLRDDYTFTPTVGLYALGAFQRNTFAGIEQRFEEGIGAQIVALNSGRNRLEFDLGVSYLQQRSTAAVELNYPAGRGAIVYRYTFAQAAYFEQSVVDLSDLDRVSNSLVTSTTALVAPLSKQIGVKLGYQILYSGDPPPGFKTTDRILTTSLQVNI
jgi:putative salt-induced outer membrane protein